MHELSSSHPPKNELAKICRRNQSGMKSEDTSLPLSMLLMRLLFCWQTATADRGHSGKCVFNIVEAPEGVPKRFDNRLRL